MQPFDNKIHKVIDLYSHPVWFILRDDEVDCPCVDYTAKTPDLHCKKCFGTGKKVKLARVNAAHQNYSISVRGTGMGFSETDIVAVYYTKQKTSLKVGDIIVDNDSIDTVKDVYYEHSDSADTVYWRIETVPIKVQPQRIKDMLSETLKEAGIRE